MAGRGKGKKTDIGWNYFADINRAERIVQCSYCHRFIHGGITRGKEHLAGISGNTAACLKVPSEVRLEINKYMRAKRVEKAKAKKKNEMIIDELTRVREEESDVEEEEDDDDDNDNEECVKLRRAMCLSRETHQSEELRRRGPGESSAGMRRSASMRVDGNVSSKRGRRPQVP